jgi:hypothetical protein
MEAALRALLTGYGPLTALVPADDRIVWNHLPQATARPAIVLFKISGSPGITMQGSDGLTGSIVQIDVQALKVTDMWAIRDQIVSLLHGYHDATFPGIFADGDRQTSEELTGGGIVHRASLDFNVWYAA